METDSGLCKIVTRDLMMSLLQTLKNNLPRFLKNPLQDRLNDFRDRRDAKSYKRAPWFPPPHIVKVGYVLENARKHGIEILVETGTFQGEMVRKCLPNFNSIYSIELGPSLAAAAARKFSRYAHISIIEGDSTSYLPGVLKSVEARCLFWLDGHYSGETTAGANVETPLRAELRAIGEHVRNDHVILIDDARLLGKGDYPSFEELKKDLLSINPDFAISIQEDIVVCEPPRKK
jgi:hypothetical protein